MKESELKNQKTFFKYKNGNWYDCMWEFEVSFNSYKENGKLCSHCEVDGRTWFLKYLKDVNDLKTVYEALTDKKFEF